MARENNDLCAIYGVAVPCVAGFSGHRPGLFDPWGRYFGGLDVGGWMKNIPGHVGRIAQCALQRVVPGRSTA
ncbi:hypothetical protein [uncultured Thalassospira sp.]|uniref:hypothetical protein n=1 Tax=uncultured Thalassospira sp. TaxID=404382 RepID=UPI0030DCA105